MRFFKKKNRCCCGHKHTEHLFGDFIEYAEIGPFPCKKCPCKGFIPEVVKKLG